MQISLSHPQTRHLASTVAALNRPRGVGRLERKHKHLPAHLAQVLRIPDTLKAQAYVNKPFLEEPRLSGNLAASVHSLICPAPSNNIDPIFLPAASSTGQPKLTSVGTVQGTGCMNSTILCWPTLAPLSHAMNRAVWKKKNSHTKQKQQNLSLCDAFKTG